MTITVIDIETSFSGKWGDDSDPSPYNPLNKLVSVGYKTATEEGYLFFHHDEISDKYVVLENREILQRVLDNATCIVGHNLKFDMSWLFECGFTYNGLYFDTMIFEYIQAKGLNIELSLKACLLRHGLEPKSDILQEYCGNQGLNVNQVPIKELEEYGLQDIRTTWDLFNLQKKLIETDPLVKSTRPVIRLMNEFLEVLIDVERNGIKIDIEALDKVEVEFKQRHKELEAKLTRMTQEVMGHTPINLSSPEQLSWVLYSIKVNDKSKWSELFNLGTEIRNGVSKQKYPKRYPDYLFRALLKEHSRPLCRTVAEQCPDCMGRGYIRLKRKDGSERSRENICKRCQKTGFLYTDLPQRAGFNIKPISSEYAASGGFSASKDTIDDLLELGELTANAKEFLIALKEYNAISTYLSSFVEGIRKNVRATSILHTTFNQCVTATGRLSSTRPNLQNQPRESTFPIRKSFISRFLGGSLLNADFAQLEFRVAAFLAQCDNAIHDIISKVDIHRQTAAAIKGSDDISKEERQDAKKYTFRPLFGGTSGTEAQKAYFEYFFSHYSGIFNWHTTLIETAIKNKYIQTPSGRIFAFPNCIRKSNGSASFATQIKNYPVQSFATGDILPVTMLILYRLMQKHKVRSKLCLTVHDSITADVHPEERDLMIKLFKEAFADTIPALKQRFGVDFNIPLDFDLEIGYNLLQKDKVK